MKRDIERERERVKGAKVCTLQFLPSSSALRVPLRSYPMSNRLRKRPALTCLYNPRLEEGEWSRRPPKDGDGEKERERESKPVAILATAQLQGGLLLASLFGTYSQEKLERGKQER